MKKTYKYFSLPILFIGLLGGCHDIDVPITTQLTTDVFPQDSIQFVEEAGVVYAALRGNYALDYWFMQSLSTDEAILPARGGNWYDNQNYKMLHYHSWTPDHPWTSSCWSWLSRVIGYTNQTLSILDDAMPEGTSKSTMFAQIKMVRAIAYFMMMDLYGNVPIDTVYGDYTAHAKMDRDEVFNFIEDEVQKALPNLTTDTGTSIYGMPNKYTAYALLSKMYLNAEYYTGTEKYDDCIAACDKIIQSEAYEIEPRSSYLQMFYPDNGPQMKEFIFAIPYDPAATPLANTNGYMYRSRYDLQRYMKTMFGLSFNPSGPESTLPEFYAYFDDPDDIRNEQWLTGLQYYADGSPAYYQTTKKGYNQFYTGSDGDATYVYQVELTPDIILRQNVDLFDCGNDEIAWNMGYRNIKFYPDNTSTNRNQNNDMPLFRYSDIILMKAEAILRGGSATLGQTPLSLVNMVRQNRTTSTPWNSVTLEDLYKERSREFAYETWRRNDMIRFGKYESSWGFKTNTDTYRRVFPIPTGAMTLNPALTQNPEY